MQSLTVSSCLGTRTTGEAQGLSGGSMTHISNISLIYFHIPSLTDSGNLQACLLHQRMLLGIHLESNYAGVPKEGREQPQTLFQQLACLSPVLRWYLVADVYILHAQLSLPIPL